MIENKKQISPVRFYLDASGKEPVREWLESLSPEDQRIVVRDIKAVQIKWPTASPFVRPCGENLWEIRSTLLDVTAYIRFYINGGHIVLMEAQTKKTE